MSADKRFNVSFKTDVKGLKEAHKALSDLAAMGNKVAKAFQGVTLGAGGGVGARGALSKSLLEEKKLFEGLGTAGEKLAKILNQNVIKSQTDLQKALKNTDKDLDGLVKKYEVAERRLQNNKLRYRQEKLTADRDMAFGQIQEKAQDRLLLQQAVGGGAGSGGGSFGGGMGMGGPMMGLLAGGGAQAMGMGGVASTLMRFVPQLVVPMAIAGAAAAVAKTYQFGLSAQGGFAASQLAPATGLAGVASGYMGAATGGNNRLALGVGLGAENPEAFKGATWWNKNVSQFGSALSSVPTWIFQDEQAFQQEYRRRQTLKLKEARLEVEGTLAATAGPEMDAAEYQLSTYGTQRDFTTRFGSKAWGAMNAAGAGNLLLADRTRALAEPAAQFVGVRGAAGLGMRAANMYQYGWNPGRALGIMGRAAVGGGNVLGATSGYGLDVEMQALMGETATSTMGPESMMYAGKGVGLANAMAGGVFARGGAQGMREAQQIGMGMGLQGQMAGGHNAYQQSYNLAAAAAVLGPGAGPYKMNFLATQMKDPAVLADIARGKLPTSFANMGITIGQAQAALQDMQGGMLARFYDTGETGKGFDRMRAAREAGGFGRYLKGMGRDEARAAISEMAPLLAQTEQDLFGGDVGKAEGYLMGERGLAAPRAQARGTGAGVERTKLDEVKAEQEAAMNATARDLNINFEKLDGSVVKLNDVFEVLIKSSREAVQRSGAKPSPSTKR